MKAIRVHQFGGPDVLRLEETPDPAAGAGEVLVRVKAAGVNPVDTYIRTGRHAVKPALPYIPGSDAAGIVEAVGSSVAHVRPGGRVYVGGTITGTYAELALGRADQVYPLPDRVTFAQGAAVHVPYATAYRALFRKAHALPGETVLVHGASGGVGIATVQLARAHGLTVIGTAGTEQGLKLARDAGAHHALNHHRAEHVEAARQLTGGRGFDVIIEMLANVNLNDDLALLARRGRLVVVGNRGTIEIDPRRLMRCDGTIHGLMLFNATADELASIHAALGAGLANGTLMPVVGREFPLSEAARAHEAVLEPGARGKIVLIP
ncbi:MAG: NADPH:quinone reductase [Acidobacteria bacterium]|nr:NADPH:quinone reductase [Acidobacteriota bacterium]